MEFSEIHKLALDELAKTGMKTRNCLPPIHRLLWRFGVNIRPPHYSSFVEIVIWIATLFTLLFGTLMTLITGAHDGQFLTNFSFSAGIGFLLGLFMAFYYRHGNVKYGLSKWEDLGATGSRKSTDNDKR